MLTWPSSPRTWTVTGRLWRITYDTHVPLNIRNNIWNPSFGFAVDPGNMCTSRRVYPGNGYSCGRLIPGGTKAKLHESPMPLMWTELQVLRCALRCTFIITSWNSHCSQQTTFRYAVPFRIMPSSCMDDDIEMCSMATIPSFISLAQTSWSRMFGGSVVLSDVYILLPQCGSKWDGFLCYLRVLGDVLRSIK